MGARVSGAGTPRIVVEGVSKLAGARHTVLPDRIETGTYAMAVAMTGGDVQLAGARPELLQSALDVLTQAGAIITVNNEGIRVARNGAGIRPVRSRPRRFRLSDRSAGAVDGADGLRRRRLADYRDDFRKSLHACAGAGAVRRADHLDGETATIDGSRNCAARR